MINTLKRGMPNRLYHKILLIMRLTTVLLIVSLMQVSAAGLAQRVTMNQKNTSLENVLKALRQQTGYNVLYDVNLINKARPVNLNLKDAAVEEAMTQILKGQALEYKIEERNIIIKPKEPSFLDKASSVIQSAAKDLFRSIDVRGVIRDEQGNPMPNATIVVKGKSQVYRSNNKGEFNIPNVADDAVLVISYVGYQRLEINVKDATMPLEIKLNMATGELEEVKIEYSTGYQNIPKERATGSFVQLNNELINRQVSTNILDRLIGITSSFNFQPNTNEQNKRGAVTIRGASTINANNEPLIVVDGFPYGEGSDFTSFFQRLNNLNPNDVLSITVLRDAAAASIWGARSGNGVIVITTKRGNFNQPAKLSFNSSVNIGERPDLFYNPVISPADMVDFEIGMFNNGFYDSALGNTTTNPVVSPVVEILAKKRAGTLSAGEADSQLAALKTHDLRNDINKYLRQNSINQQYNLNVSGGSQVFNYYSSVGYDKNRTSNIGDENSRFTFRFDNTFKPIKQLEISSFINYTQSQNQSNGISSVIGSPYLQLADGQGNALAIPQSYRQSAKDNLTHPGFMDWNYRPLDELGHNDNLSKQFDIRLGGNIRYTILKGLTAEGRYQYQKTLGNFERYYTLESYFTRNLVNQYMQMTSSTAATYPIPNSGGILDRGNTESTGWNIRGQLNFNRNWGLHEIALLAGAEARQTLMEGKGTDRIYGFDGAIGTFQNVVNYENYYSNNLSGGNRRIPTLYGQGTSETINRYLSYFSNGAYTYKGRYTVSASSRIDGSNFFGIKANQRILPLWSLGASWNIAEENFYNIAWLPYLKLRATYGFNGNMRNDAAAYPVIGRFIPSFDSLNGAIYGRVISPGNPALRWEKVQMINYGLDFESKNKRITGSVEYYTKKGIDLLGPILTDQITGFNSFQGNRASIKSEGMDLNLNTINSLGKFIWSANFLFSYNTEKVTEYESAGTLISSVASYFSGLVIDKPLDALYSYRWAGLDPVNGAPRIYAADAIIPFNAQNQVKPIDLIYHGTTSPLYFGSLKNTISYKNMSLSFNLMYKLGYYLKKNTIRYSDLFLTYSMGGHSDYYKRWQKPGDESVTNVPSAPSAYDSSRDGTYLASSINVEKADHVRLQDIRLNYDIDKLLFKRLPIQRAQFYVYASNLGVVWSANKLNIDPDFNDLIPNPRFLALGLNFLF